MKLKINGFDNEITFDGECINVLIIKDKKCFRHIMEVLFESMQGEEELEIVLLTNEEERMKISDNIYVMFDLFNIDYNSKNVLNKLYNIVQNNMENNQDNEFDECIYKIRKKIIQEINELPFEFQMKDDINISDILKLYNLKIDSNNYNSITDRVELMINLMATLKTGKILIIPNLKMYLTDEELLEIYKYSMYNDIEILLIETNESTKLKDEKIMLIDSDYNDYIE